MNKGISDITYNVLNLPLTVDIKSPVAEARNEYSYSAGGQKLKVVRKWPSSYSTTPVIGSAVNTSALNNSKTIDYVGNIIYEDGSLKEILTENGYYDGENYYFYVKNHLGSNVMVINRNTGNSAQNNHYYPFGLTMGISTNQGAQPYKYTGKELDMEHGLMQYDQLARTYDPAIGRFLSIDPLCEKYYWISPYAYCLNNPVNAIDPDGKEIIFIIRNGSGKITNQLTYRNGNFWYSNGDRYNSSQGSISNTLDRTLAVYQKIENSGNKVLINQLNTLENSSNTHYVEGRVKGLGSMVKSHRDGKTYLEKKTMVENKKSIGTHTGLDFSEEAKAKFKESTGVESTDFTTVAHEMQHQYDFDQGNMSDSNGKGAKDPSEIRAVKNENRARKIENLSPRIKYGEEIINLNKLK
jgi:RHS repeat-associated protein